MRKLLLFLLLTTGSCATDNYPIGVPSRPILIPLTAEMQQEISPDALDIIAVNDAALKNHIKRLEQRIILHDESL